MVNKEAIQDGPYKAGDGTWIIDLKPGYSTQYGTNYIQCRTKSECLAELVDVSKDEELEENATQASSVSGGKVSIFGSPDNFDHNAWYKQLFEVRDADKNWVIKNTKLNKYLTNRLSDDMVWQYTASIEQADMFDTYEDAYDFIDKYVKLGDVDAENWEEEQLV